MNKSKKIIFIVFIFALLGCLVMYVVWPSWEARAARDLAIVHHAIDEMHPAVLDAVAFHTWHTQGYKQVKELLPLIKSLADEQALLRFYFAGYEDSHLSGSITQHFAQNIFPSNERWAGWVLKFTNTGYKVAYSLQDGNTPAVGAQLLRCDGQAIDGLLKTNFAPFFDRRWQIPIAREHAAIAFTILRDDTSVLNRPIIKSCEFVDVSGKSLTYPLRWQTLTAEQTKAINEIYSSPYSLPSIHEFAPKSYWVTASDFKLGTKQAYESQQVLLKNLETLKDIDLVVFDVRANGGGNSQAGIDILNAVFKEYFYFLYNQYYQKMSNSDALFRVSAFTLWSWEALLSEKRKTLPADSAAVKQQTQLVNIYRNALDRGETHIWQSAIYGRPSSLNADLANQAWNFKGKVVLLTSKTCVSACLDFVDFLKFVPNLLHVGDTTNADTIYTEVAFMRDTDWYEQLDFIVPVKKFNHRLRDDNVPYVPDVFYDGDIGDTPRLQKWILEQVKTH